ncbi:MAG: 3',5'-cyclic AMP phosphodiesterase CpdA [Candidatus Electronema aureum]|uniref:3',5'-cyclic AMP phosphodiesterase CpdA n=1 Tax=Candidatus Electronema aureum TaxID=2005002 RepID=A0A521FZ34_9BACT|nr:MAG: 3',5'-cyclic AMP phosphodiesterase CpdA [Candidatus Electronema aureum]
MRIIHLSDIHVGKDATNIREQHFSSIVNWILNKKNLHQADYVIITGDIVHNGRSKEYQDAQVQINKLNAGDLKVFSVPGNHDYGFSGIVQKDKCIYRFKEYIVDNVHLTYPYCDPNTTYPIVLLDSMLSEMQNNHTWGAQGEIGAEQLKTLEDILYHLDSTGKRAIVALHHHPFFYNNFLQLRDDDAFKSIIKQKGSSGASRVKCVLFGHKHVEKRFNGDDGNREKEYGIDVIFASGSTTEPRPNYADKLVVPVIDLQHNAITNFSIS